MFKYDWVWKKPRGTGHLNAKRQPMRDKEDILVFADGVPPYNPQFGKGEPYTKAKGGKNTKTSAADCYGSFFNGAEHRNDNSGYRYPKQVIEFGVVERNTLHPTQKPVPLFEYLIRTYTDEGETVLDNCMGSGTTGVACVNTGRNFIGIEIDKQYLEVAYNRILAAKRVKEEQTGI